MDTEPVSLPPASPMAHARLARATQDRHLGGVAGGTARHLGVNVTLVRVAMVALTLVSFGAAISAYLAAWLLLPDDTGAEGPAIRWFHEHGSDAGALVTLLVLTLLGVVAITMAADVVSDGDAIPWIIAIGVAAYLLTTRSSGAPATAVAPAGSSPPDATTVQPAALVPAMAPLPPPPAVAPPRPADPIEVARRRRHRAVRNTTVLTAGLVGAAMSILWAVGGLSIAGWVVPASVLLVLVIGLAMAPVTGWSWTLAVLTVLVVPLLVLTLIPGSTLRGGLGSRTAQPRSVAEIPPHYRLGIGTQDVDLTALEMQDGQIATVRVALGIGGAEVQVPADATVRIVGRVSAGSIRVDGMDIGVEGTDLHTDRTIPALTGAPTGTIVIRPEVGIGTLDVRRDL